MKNIKNILIGISIACVVAVSLVVVFGISKVRATSALNLVTSNTTRPLATTTTSYMTAGTGTTTLPFNTNGIDQIAFNVLYVASSTVNSNILNWRYEYSLDGSVWYSEDIELATNSTTTPHVRTFADHSWQFASSTAASSQQNIQGSINYKHWNLTDIASPFTRVVFYVPIGSGPAAIDVKAVTKAYNVN